jgi:molybdopterin-synthase adenylyltransferase
MARSREHGDSPSAPAGRYSRQILLPQIGADGQRRLAASRVCLVGCGALGTVLAETLVRAGVGHLRICDRDVVELDNLTRQVLFDETDLEAGLPKAEAARLKLARINREVTVEAHVLDVNHTNIERLAADADMLLDGTDNFETRYLINDLAVQSGRPWVYGAVVGVTGLCMPIVPGEGPCLRCVFPEPPPPELTPTCDTAGVLGTAVNVVASLQATEALKLLTGQRAALNRGLTSVDLWSGRWVTLNVGAAGQEVCPCCGERRFEYLAGTRAGQIVNLCGRNALQIHRAGGRALDLEAMAAKWRGVATGSVRAGRFMLQAVIDGFDITVFPDGRALIQGTTDVDVAKAVYAKYVGA